MGKVLNLLATESNLVEALRKKDPRAQRQVYDRLSKRMFGVCLRYVPDYMAAEDVLIKGFLRVFEKIDQFKDAGSFEGWIRKIMVNESLGYLRQQQKIIIQLDDSMDSDGRAISTPPDSILEADDLLKMINSLPIGYRTVFNLYAIEGYSHTEIAESLGISESTSKSQLHRARAHLQKLLVENGEMFKKKVNTSSFG